MHVLVVDDEPLIARTLGLIFERNGFQVTTAHSTESAMLTLTAATPDLLLCDIDMPGRDGIALMTDFGRKVPGCPILVLTGSYNNLGRVRACALTLRQAVQVATKPCQPVDLLRTAHLMLRTA